MIFKTLCLKVRERKKALLLKFEARDVVGWERKLSKLAKDRVIMDLENVKKRLEKKDETVYYVYKLGAFVDKLKKISEKTGLYFDVTHLKGGTLSGKTCGEAICTYGHQHEKMRGELYYVLKNNCLLELADLKTLETFVVSLKEGDYIFIHPRFSHRLISLWRDCIVLGVVPKDAGHNYEIIKGKGFPFHVFIDVKRRKIKFVHNKKFPGASLVIDEISPKRRKFESLLRNKRVVKILKNPKVGKKLYYFG